MDIVAIIDKFDGLEKGFILSSVLYNVFKGSSSTAQAMINIDVVSDFAKKHLNEIPKVLT